MYFILYIKHALYYDCIVPGLPLQITCSPGAVYQNPNSVITVSIAKTMNMLKVNINV